jgi:hypothetical protein
VSGFITCTSADQGSIACTDNVRSRGRFGCDSFMTVTQSRIEERGCLFGIACDAVLYHQLGSQSFKCGKASSLWFVKKRCPVQVEQVEPERRYWTLAKTARKAFPLMVNRRSVDLDTAQYPCDQFESFRCGMGHPRVVVGLGPSHFVQSGYNQVPPYNCAPDGYYGPQRFAGECSSAQDPDLGLEARCGGPSCCLHLSRTSMRVTWFPTGLRWTPPRVSRTAENRRKPPWLLLEDVILILETQQRRYLCLMHWLKSDEGALAPNPAWHTPSYLT